MKSVVDIQTAKREDAGIMSNQSDKNQSQETPVGKPLKLSGKMLVIQLDPETREAIEPDMSVEFEISSVPEDVRDCVNELRELNPETRDEACSFIDEQLGAKGFRSYRGGRHVSIIEDATNRRFALITSKKQDWN